MYDLEASLMLAFVAFGRFLNFSIFEGNLNLGFATGASEQGCFHFWINLGASDDDSSEAYQSIDFFRGEIPHEGDLI